jgi:hypothetical protein
LEVEPPSRAVQLGARSCKGSTYGLTRLTTARNFEFRWESSKIENTGDTKGHEGPRYRQEQIDANRGPGQFRWGAKVDGGGMKVGREGSRV